MCTHLILISTLTSTNPSRSRERTTRQAMASGPTAETSYSNGKWNRFACANSPNFNLHADLHQSISVQRAHNLWQWYQDNWQRLATAMRSGIDLHVHSPNFNLHADLHQSVSVQRAHNHRKWPQEIGTDYVQQ